MATATRTKTWVDAEDIDAADANGNWNTLFTFFSASGSVVHNDGSQAFSADVTFPRTFGSSSGSAVRKRQADMSPELIGGSPNCWYHGAAHLPALGTPYMQAGDTNITTGGLGVYDIALPAAFTTDILTVIVMPTSASPTASSVHIYATPTGSTLSNIRCIASAGTTMRLSWIVIGW